MRENSAFTLWQKCLKCLQSIIPRKQFVKYISPLQIKFNQNNIIILAPNYYILDKITIQYFPIIKNILNDIKKEQLNIEITVGSNTIDNKNYEKEKKPLLINNNNLNIKYKLENFIGGKLNNYTLKTAINTSKNPGITNNPLLIYGSTGTGKTHLANAIGNEILKTFPKFKILYTNAENFINNMIISIKKQSITDFKEQHRTCDVLIIDDLQFFSGKEKSQEELLHTLNSLCEKQKQIIIISEKNPLKIENLNEKLKSKLTSGSIIQTFTPELKSRIEIIKNKETYLGIKLNKQTQIFIAKNINTNIKEIENLLNNIATNVKQKKNKITTNAIKNIINTNLKTKQTTLNEIIEAIKKYYNIDHTILTSKKRNKSTVTIRQIMFYLSKELTQKSLSEIGNALGKYSHTTVLYSYKKIKNSIKLNEQISNDINNIKKDILGY